MHVFSLFDGMSCGQIVLDKLGIHVDNYYASEIDKYAIQVAKANYPDIIHVGDVTEFCAYSLHKIDLLIGGSPCQGFSFAGKGLNFEDPRSKLFFEYVRILKECNPKYFLFENVRMKQEYQDIISDALGVKPIVINSSLVSAQNRVRLYWTNIPVDGLPKDKGILLRDIYCKDYDDSLVLKGKGLNKLTRPRNRAININSDKTPTLLKSQERKPTDSIVFKHGDVFRYPTRRECELMQTVPQGYTNVLTYTRATGVLGNGWTIDVITHILKGINS